MLPEIEGTQLPNPIWSAFSFDRVLQYYDGPRLLLQRNQTQQLFLAWWSDSDDSIERWIYLPVSVHRLYEILSGEIPSLDSLNAPEDGSLFVVDKDLNTNSIIRTVLTAAAALPDDALPRPGARLNIPVPEEVSGLPSREGSHILAVRMESKPSDLTGRISAKVVSQITGNLQRLVDALGQAKSGEATSRGGIPDAILNETRLDPISTYTGSFGIRFETNTRDDLFGGSLARTSLQGLFDLVDIGYQAPELTSQLTELKSRVVKNYKDFLSTIEASLSVASLSWSQPGKMDPRQVRINQELARNIIAQIDAVTDLTQDNLTLEGTLIGGNVRTLRFEIAALDTDERFDGSIHEDAISEVKRMTLNSSCRVIMQPNLQVNEVTGEEKTTYTLLGIQSM